MTQPVKDCNCEDWSCCEHADNYPNEGPPYCDMCGLEHYGDCWENLEWDDEDEEDEENEEENLLPIHRTQATFPLSSCSTCGGGGCLDCTDPA